MSEITLYDRPDFEGKSKEFVANESDLVEKMFANVARSARMVGQHWVLYMKAGFTGEFLILGPGDHKSLGKLNQKCRSLRLVSESLMNPENDLFEHVGYGGKSRTILKKADDLRRGDINDMASSHKVKRGVWILHQGFNQTGPRLITFKGDEWPSYFIYDWNDKLSSLRPLVNSYTEGSPSPRGASPGCEHRAEEPRPEEPRPEEPRPEEPRPGVSLAQV